MFELLNRDVCETGQGNPHVHLDLQSGTLAPCTYNISVYAIGEIEKLSNLRC